MLLEVVERLCSVTAEMLDIIDTQAIIIEQSEIADSIKEELQSMRKEAREEFQGVAAKYNERK